jgi:hypothetical protein
MTMVIAVRIIDSAAIMGKVVCGVYPQYIYLSGSQIRFEPVNKTS